MNLKYICLTLIAIALTQLAQAAGKPNFVFILADDVGWTGTSVPSDNAREDSRSDLHITPSLEKLASQGMVFSNAYSPAPMCTPSRASILTGKSPAQLHITTPGPYKQPSDWQKVASPKHINELPEAEITIAEHLKQLGYTTAHFGKWHLGNGGPGHHGFDKHDGETGNGGPGGYDAPNPKDIYGVTERAIKFIETNAKSHTPFYVQLSHYAVHSPTKATQRSTAFFADKPLGKNHDDRAFAAMTLDLDNSIGILLDRIKDLGLVDNTFVIFMSDNGAGGKGKPNVNHPLAGGKASLWEGGIRIPFIIRGPGVKQNSYCHIPVIGLDLFPTIASLAGKMADIQGIEGSDLSPTFAEPTKTITETRPLVFHFPHYGMGPRQKPQSAIRCGDLKLIYYPEDQSTKLYNLSDDLGETIDISARFPSKTKTMSIQLRTYLQTIGAQFTSPNPSYDPSSKSSTSSSQFIKRLDKNGDGKVSSKEFPGSALRFSQLDSNNDGAITSDEAPKHPSRR